MAGLEGGVDELEECSPEGMLKLCRVRLDVVLTLERLPALILCCIFVVAELEIWDCSACAALHQLETIALECHQSGLHIHEYHGVLPTKWKFLVASKSPKVVRFIRSEAILLSKTSKAGGKIDSGSLRRHQYRDSKFTEGLVAYIEEYDLRQASLAAPAVAQDLSR